MYEEPGPMKRFNLYRACAGLVCFLLTGCGGGGNGDVSSANQAPIVVELIQVSASTAGALTVSWLPASDDTTPASALMYQVHVSTDAGFTPGAGTLKFEGTGVTTATINAGLTTGTRYAVRLVVLDASGASTASSVFGVTVPNVVTPAGLGSIAPAEAMRTVRTSFAVVGTDLPVGGVRVSVPGDARAQCESPTSLTATGFTVACTLYRPGSQALEIRSGATLLATAHVNVTTNVADMTWAAPSTGNVHGKGTVNFGETVTFKATGINLLADPHMGFSVQQCSTPDVETGTPTATERSFTCVFSGTQAGQMAGTLQDAPAGTTVYSLQVPLATAPVIVSKFPDTGITADQCYAAGSNALVSCTSTAAIALNASQDGMVGRDVTVPAAADGKLGFSYSLVESYSKEECVKDSTTGLTWEGKPTSGQRAAGNTYTNFDSTTAAQFWNGTAFVNPTQEQVDAATNTAGYIAAVNAAKLCGYSDWRLPTANELQTMVDRSVAFPGPTVDSTWFPNTQQKGHWTSTGYAADASYAWDIDFYQGVVSYGYRYSNYHVRLVR